MRILLLSETLNRKRGYGRFAYDLAEALTGIGHTVTALVVRGEEAAMVARPVLLKSRRLGMLINPFIIAWYARRNDIIHALDGYPYGIYAALAAVLLGKRNVITMQGTYAVEPLTHGIKGGLLAWAYKKADALTAISRFTKEQVLQRINGLDISVINHGVRHNSIESSGPPRIEGRYILSVGTLIERKGYHISLPAFASLRRSIPDVKYVIVGKAYSPEYRRYLENIIESERMQQSVLFVENISEQDLANFYAHAELFLLPSVNQGVHFEGFGLVYLEAGLYGVPVVAARGSGAEDAVEDGLTGFLVPQEDVAQTTAAMLRIMTDKEVRKKMGDANRHKALQSDWLSIARNYVKVYAS